MYQVPLFPSPPFNRWWASHCQRAGHRKEHALGDSEDRQGEGRKFLQELDIDGHRHDIDDVMTTDKAQKGVTQSWRQKVQN